MCSDRVLLLALVLGGTSACFAGGCAKSEVKDYVPADDAARRALVAALDAWRQGKPHQRVETVKPQVEVLDSGWKEGKQLESYQILGPASGDDQNKRFRVKLQFAGGAAEEAVYVVVGKDPIWVFHSRDYQQASGM
jgi:hypothetical protein